MSKIRKGRRIDTALKVAIWEDFVSNTKQKIIEIARRHDVSPSLAGTVIEVFLQGYGYQDNRRSWICDHDWWRELHPSVVTRYHDEKRGREMREKGELSDLQELQSQNVHLMAELMRIAVCAGQAIGHDVP